MNAYLMKCLLTVFIVSKVNSYTVVKTTPDVTHHKVAEPDNPCEDEDSVNRSQITVVNCPKCRSTDASNLSEEEVRQLKLDILKTKILEKLNMKHPPCPKKPKPDLKDLKPLLEATEDWEDENDTSENSEKSDNFVIFPSNDNFTCSESSNLPCSTFQFRLPTEIEIDRLTSAEVLFFHNKNVSLNVTSKDVINQPHLWGKIQSHRESSENEDSSLSFGWSKFLWTIPVELMLIDSDRKVSVKASGTPVEQIGTKRPFFIAYLKRTVAPRNRRSVDCVEGLKTCCRQVHYINFTEIQFNNWVIYPEGYKANYCKGKCLITDPTSTVYFHSAVLHSYIVVNSTVAESLGISMCCSPSELSSLPMIYRDSKDNIYHKKLRHMIVDSCDCA